MTKGELPLMKGWRDPMRKTNRALLIIDMLRDFIEAEGALSLGESGRQIIPAVRERLDRARARGDLVIFVRDSHRPDDPEFDMFPPHCVAGTPGAKIIPELAPSDEDVMIFKRRYSAFFATELDLVLREHGVDALDLCGVCTNICVLYTAASARNLAYAVTVHRDAVAAPVREAGEWALSEMEQTLGCTVV